VLFLLFRLLSLVSFLHDVCCQFCAISVLGCLGCLVATPCAPGDPEGSQVGKVMTKFVRGSFMGIPLATILDSQPVTNREEIPASNVLKNIVGKVL
jgi:hypothetical protein